MNHRVVNDVGYKKIFPMSLWEDDSFCHYCGRKATMLQGLEWDHVPALNVKIPTEFIEIRKTLVRACRECNGIASDTPHLEYLERHFWLKAQYLRRYKNLLVNGVKEIDTSTLNDPFLSAVYHNAKIQYEEILNAIGFGIKDIEQIESPILEVRTKKGQKISNLLINYLHGVPSELDEEPEIPAVIPADAQLVELESYCSYKEFIEFLAAEKICDAAITNEDLYMAWLKSHPIRSNALELPEMPVQLYKKDWNDIVSDVETFCRDNFENDNADIFQSNSFCSYDSFLDFLIKVPRKERFNSISEYIDWCYENALDVKELNLPEFPLDCYGMNCWSAILTDVEQIKKKRREVRLNNRDRHYDVR